MFQKTGWMTLRTSPLTCETLPEFDILEHRERNFACPCNPKIESFINDFGNVEWMIVHNSFDEYLGDDETEPYKGL